MSGTRRFVIAAGIIFAVMAAMHGARIAVEGAWLLGQPVFVATSVLSLGMALWALFLLLRRPRLTA